jgi:two-component system phosphate regulon sensor histidine kinase PhoR
MSLLGDPVWRSVFARALVAALVVVVLAALGPWWGALGAVFAAALIAGDLARRIAPLRRRVVELGARQTAEPLGLEELERSVAETHEEFQRSERKAELDRDDLVGVLEATSDGILVLGHHLRVELVNDAARRMLVPGVEPLGRALHEVARQSELIAFAEALRRGEEPAPRRIEVATGAGTRAVGLSGSVVQGANLRGRAVVVLHDLTEQRRLERVRTDFVANVTHEMRSPLASILGYAETLAGDAELSPESAEHLQKILRNTQRLDDIIRDLIELSRLEHATAPEAQPTDVRALVAGVVDAARDGAEVKRIALEVAVDALPPRLLVDPGLVHQALANLVDNAIKYTPAGGRVRVSGRMLVADEPESAESRAGGPRRLELSVADTGPGIAREHVARIFERFYRVDTARSRALGGTGLGLSIVKHAAALHGGRVRVESTPGAGATFRLELATAPAQ